MSRFIDWLAAWFGFRRCENCGRLFRPWHRVKWFREERLCSHECYAEWIPF